MELLSQRWGMGHTSVVSYLKGFHNHAIWWHDSVTWLLGLEIVYIFTVSQALPGGGEPKIFVLCSKCRNLKRCPHNDMIYLRLWNSGNVTVNRNTLAGPRVQGFSKKTKKLKWIGCPQGTASTHTRNPESAPGIIYLKSVWALMWCSEPPDR